MPSELEFWLSITDDLQEVLASEHLFDIIATLQTIGAHEYHDLLLDIMKDDFCNARFPLDDDQIKQMQHEIKGANRAFGITRTQKLSFMRQLRIS